MWANSSLTNLMQPEAAMETGSISEKIKRGKHTTRHAELFCVEEGTYLMDTPGFSSMYLEEIEPQELKDYFPEFEAYEPECRFQADCVHIGEPVCGVKLRWQRERSARAGMTTMGCYIRN